MRRRFAMFALVCATTMLAQSNAANAVTINDDAANPTYVGAISPALPSPWFQQDIIGDAALFSVESTNVEVIGGNLSVTIFSSYFDNIGALGTRLGDLFLSTNGWSPFGAAPHFDDDASNGETWEYALVLDQVDGSTTSGQVDLRAITSAADILLSTTEATGTVRLNQEVLFNRASQNASLGTGTWAISGNSLNFTISLGLLAGLGDSLGFHWTMTCANDVVEGAAPVPEPGTLILLGCGLLGVGFRNRAKKA